MFNYLQTRMFDQRIKILVRRSERPEKTEEIDLQLDAGLKFHKNQVEISKLIATATIPALLAIY